jgi:hypothetical protein
VQNTEDKAVPSDPLRSLRARYPGWNISAQGPIWVAVNRPARTRLDMLYGHTLEELGAKLDKEDQ